VGQMRAGREESDLRWLAVVLVLLVLALAAAWFLLGIDVF
jgi:hypothetical protein